MRLGLARTVSRRARNERAKMVLEPMAEKITLPKRFTPYAKKIAGGTPASVWLVAEPSCLAEIEGCEAGESRPREYQP